MVKNCALIIVLILVVFFVNATSAFASPCDLITPECTLKMFIESVKNGEGDQLRGVVIPGLFASPVVQQPEGKTGYVSDSSKVITQHHLAEMYGVIGLLAHNELNNEEYLGEMFHLIKGGDFVILIMGDGRTKLYRVEEKVYYQKLTPGSNWSRYVNLGTNEELTTWDVFSKHYQTDDRIHPVVFQTCIWGYENPTWGLLFITAKPMTFHYHISIQPH